MDRQQQTITDRVIATINAIGVGKTFTVKDVHRSAKLDKLQAYTPILNLERKGYVSRSLGKGPPSIYTLTKAIPQNLEIVGPPREPEQSPPSPKPEGKYDSFVAAFVKYVRERDASLAAKDERIAQLEAGKKELENEVLSLMEAKERSDEDFEALHRQLNGSGARTKH